MTAAFLALASAAVFGASDFFGGLASRRAPLLAVVTVSMLSGLVLLAAALPFLPGEPTTVDLLLGTASGLAGGAGVLLLYRAFVIGTMSVVSPVTAVFAAVVPALAGFAFGERPAPLALVGVAVALVAIALVSRERNPRPSVPDTPVRGVGVALLAGVAFGAFFILLERTDPAGGLWPLLGARLGTLVLVGGLLLVRGRSPRPPRAALPAILAAGTLDMAANVLYLLAVRQGFLVIVAVLASLYPATTVLLARVVMKERLRGVQVLGLVLAVAGVVAITAA